MIRPIDIRLNAAHPELPLAEAVTFTGAPSTVLVRGVPPNCGRWAITAVSVAATFPDGSTTTRAAVQSANGVWVATLPATARSGRTENGLRVMADGIDENGAAVTGYILGVADFAVASLGVTPAPEPGETSWQMLYFDAVPGTLRKGDVAKVDGVLKLYNGSAWEAFAASLNLDNSVTRSSANGVKSSGIWSAIWGALVTAPAASVHAWVTSLVSTLSDSISTLNTTKASKADATLTERGDPSTPGFSAWEITWVNPYYPDPIDGVTWHDGNWFLTVNGQAEVNTGISDRNAVSIDVPAAKAIRTALPGYRLGPDDPSNPNRDKPLASEAEAEALRTGKQNALSAQQLANIAAVPGKLDKSGGIVTGNLALYEPQNGASLYFPSSAKAKLYFGSGLLNVDDVTGRVTINNKDAAVVDNIPYALITKTVTNGAVSLDDRASNSVTISATLSPNTLTINFPTAPTGKLRDFSMRLNIAAGVTAPEIAWPQGVTLENNDGEVPEIADGGTGGSSTILYFSETENNGTTAKFLVKGEVVTAIS